MLYLIVLDQAVSPANQLLSAHSCGRVYAVRSRVYAVNFAVLLYSIIIYNIMPFGVIV